MRKILLAASALLVLVALRYVVDTPDIAPTEALAQTANSNPCASADVLTLRLGLGDGEPTDWSGRATLARSDKAVTWDAESESSPLKLAGGAQSPRILPAIVDVDLSDLACGGASPGQTVQVSTAQGDFEVDVSQLASSTSTAVLEGRAEVQRVPASIPVVSGPSEEDFPSCASLRDGSVLCAFVEYRAGLPIDTEAALKGEFESIEFDGNGDRVALVRRSDAGWGHHVYVTPPGSDVWRPVVTVLSDGNAAVLWSEQRNGNWDIYQRVYRSASGVLGTRQRLTTDPRQDFNVVASGEYIAWQARRDQGFDIHARRLGGETVRVSTSEANDWRPAIASDSKGAAWIAWDTYDAGNYDVYLRRLDGEGLGEPIAIAVSSRFEARASVAVDGTDRVWVAFEDSNEGWGKDYGDRWTGKQATPMYVNKNVLVRVWDGSLKRPPTQPRASTVDYYHDDTRIATSQRHKISIPTMAVDGTGTPWVLFRKHPLQTGRGERWRSYAAFLDGETWSKPIPVLASDHLLDRQPGVAPQPDGGLLAIYSGDKRLRAQDRQDSDIFESLLGSDTTQKSPALRPADAGTPGVGPDPVHPDEGEQIARIRSMRVESRGRELRFLRGEFHRHTEFSSHRDWDGPFEEVWRYGLDVADMDWIGPGDHDYAIGHGYLWWLQQKAADMYQAPGSFTTALTYERNVSYPSGHRNVMLPRRGIRPLPRMRGGRNVNGTEADGSPDVQNLYAYLRHFGGICSSHSSATNMGTDWRDGDEELEPVVELFQGHRQNYEVSGGPHAATGPEDTIQGYRPAGFVWEAFRKGRRLGFQASSDHVSTHLSYAIVLAEENSREGIIDAFKRRHSYAAHDNIALVVRSGDYLMGDEFSTDLTPRLQIVAHGTAPIDTVEVIRQVGSEIPEVVASLEPGTEVIDLDWSDPAAVPDETSMYYVRLTQSNGAMAWASPMWIAYRP